MKRYYILLWGLIGLLLQPIVSFGQQQTNIANTTPYKSKWSISEPFEQKVFIENNEDQLKGKIPDEKGKILYTTRITGVDLYFTPNGVTYRYDKFPTPSFDKDAKEKENKGGIQPEAQFFSIQWENTNPNVELIAEDEASFYHCYAKGNKHTVIAHAFKKILYKSLYNGIDVEYRFPENGKGLEYSIIVHPGANLSQVKLLYKDAENCIINSKGDVVSQSSFGNFIDHAPTKVFYMENEGKAQATFTKKGNEISFSSNYDRTKTLVIDPWSVNPSFTGYDAGYDIAYDLKGNAYVYGSFNPYQEIKIDSNGNIKWVFNAIYPNAYLQFGGFAVDEESGTSYLGSATYPTILKINTLGIQIDSFYIGSSMEELFRMAYNKCLGQLVLGGGGITDSTQVCLLDTALTRLKPYNVLRTTEIQHDVALLAIDNLSSSFYVAIMESNNDRTLFDNVLVNCSLPSMTTNYIVSDNFSFYEGLPGLSYIDGVNGYSLSPNGAVVGNKWVYLYDGDTLRRYNKTNGTNTLSKRIGGTKYNWSGIDMDICENLYLANNTQIKIYDTALNNTGTINIGKTIYDMHTTPCNQLIVCGDQFVSGFTQTNITPVLYKSYPNACVGAVARVQLNLCSEDSSQFTYLWSNGATTRTVIGLSIGSYTVTVSPPRCDYSITDTFSVRLADFTFNTTINATRVSCNGRNNGSATSTISGGKAPYTYLWSGGGGTNANASGLSAGTYTLNVTDSCGDRSTATVTITQPNILTDSIHINSNVHCFGEANGSATVTPTGGTAPYTYLWTPSGETTATATGLRALIYSVLVTDFNGCGTTANVVITQPLAIVITPTVLSNVTCIGGNNGSASAIVNRGDSPYTYLWSGGGGTNSTATGLRAGVYTVTVTGTNGCSGTASVTIGHDTLNVTTTAVNVSCNGNYDGSASSTVSGGSSPYTYQWSNGKTTPSISNLFPRTYTLSVIDNCGDLAQTTVTITQPPPIIIVSNSIPDPGNCLGSAWVNVSGGTPAYTYLWSPGGYITDSIYNKCPGVYCCTVTDAHGCIDSACVTVGFDAGIDNIASNNGEINVYPNPGNGVFTFESSGIIGKLSAEIYNVLGQEIKNQELKGIITEINLSNQPNGIYFYRVLEENGNLIGEGKLIIQK